MSLIIDVISRKTTVKQTLINPGDVTLVIYEPSVVQVHAPASAVVRYVHEGNDLLIYMQDGTVIRCNGYFLQATNTTEPSELVFADGQQLTHVAFADAASGGLAPVELTAQTTAIESIAPFLDTVGQTSAFPWGWLAAAAVGGGGLGALLASGGGDSSKTEVINNTPPSEPGNATPSFLVTDNQGEQRGILSANDITDDTTPTFSGTGQAEATIQIKDSNGNTIASTQVDSKGHWSVSLPTQSAGEHTWSVVQIVGNTTTDAGSITLTIDNSQAAVQFATTAGDNIINASEQAAGFTLSGASSHLVQGTELTVTLNDKTYTATVGANGTWRVQVPTADAQALSEGNQVVLVSGKDATGNTVTGAQRLTVDTQPPTLTINAIAQDNIINAAEHNVALVLSGTSNAETGQIVTLTLNGTVHTATVGHNGGWQVTLPASDVQALADGRYTLNASVSDRAGNMTSDSANFTVDTHVPTISVNTVAGDDILNNAEQAVAQIISGRVSGASPGDTVTVKLGTGVLTGVVLADGTWNVALDPALTRTLDRGVNTIIVSVTDAAGNMGTATHNISLVGVAPLITLNTVSGDDVINAAEKGAPLTLTGSTQQVEAGQTVTVTLAGQNFTTTVQSDGSWSVTVPASAVGNLPDGAVAITASVTDASGNTGDTSRTITVDSQAPALSIDPLTADNIINASESGQNLQISGTTDAQPGQTVTVTLNGQTYQGTVQPDGTWSVSVPAANVGALADGNATVTASVTDVAGNPSSISRVALVDTTPPVVTINPVATDNVINTPEHAQAQIISGTVTGAQAGDIVTVTLNNVNYTTVVDVSGNWSLGVPASVVSGLADGSYPVSVSVTDRAGNTGSQSLTVTVDTAAPVIGINTIAGDDVINASEKGADVQITGTSDQPANTAITVTLNGQNYTTTTDASGNWSITVPASAVTALGQANYTVTAAVTSDIGNSATASHNVLVDSALPGVTINSVATDDIINAAEAGVAQTISGQVTGAAVGDTVTVTLGGNTYTTTVQAGLSWSVSVPATDIQALGNGDLTVNASVTNQNGNTGSGTRDITIDANLPGLRVDTVAGDDVVNIIEHGQALVVTGSSSGLAEGTPLTVTINNVEYTTAVQADGSWSVGVTAAQVSAWPAGALNITVSGADGAGNPVSITHPVTVDLTPAAITINTIATDDVINAVEKGADLTLSGTTTNVEAGQTVTVTFGGKNYTATVASDGSWTATVPAADLALLTDGSASAQASVSNINGNSASAVHNYSVDSSAPTIIINTVASDNIVNASEADAGVTVSGTTTVEAGQIVTITLNSPTVQTYQATVQADGSWSVNIPAADLAALADGSHTLTATVNDKAGNPASTTHNLAVDLTVPVLTINTIAGDDIINATEHGQALVISGSSTGGEAGDVVTVTLNSKTYTTTLDASGNWSVGVPAADIQAIGNGDLTVNASVTNGVGNTGSGSREIVIDANLPGLRVDTVAGDDVVNSIEHAQALVITGSSSGLAAGAALTVVINNVTYGATVLADGTWSVGVSAADVSNWPAGTVNITVSGASSAGNPVSITHPVTVDLAAVAISINTVSGDDVINAAEKGADLTLSGSTSGVEPGQTVTVTFGGKSYTATVAGDGRWTTTVPAADLSALRDGDATVQASVSNVNGNTASATHAYSVDATAPTLLINTIASDDILNAAEAGNPLTISGSSTAEAGQTVTVTLNGVTYTGTVQADGSWSVSVPTADLSNLTASQYTVSASVNDKAGNPATATHGLAVDLTVPVLTINTVSGDDIINAAEHGQALVISGSSTGGEAGDVITVTLNSKTYSTTLDASGNWSVGVPAADVTALGSGSQTITAAITDAAGNIGNGTHTVTVDLVLPTININIIASDDVINATEKGADLQITGTSNQPAGTTITVTLNGQNYIATTDSNGNWSATVPASAVSALGEANYTVTANVTDTAGNSNSASHYVLVNSALPAVTINAVATDDIINAAEAGNAQIISGQVTGAAAGDTVTVTLGGNTYTATVLANLSWSVNVPAADIQALGNGPLTVNASVTNIVGNTGSGSRDITIDANLPGLRVDTVAGDDVINSIEHSQALVITGSSTGLTAGTALTIVINNVTYAATVLADGTWNLGIPAADVSNWPAGTVDIAVSGSNSAGNPVNITHPVTVDLSAVVVTINTVAGDDVINALEKSESLVLTGSTTNVEAGQTVTVVFGGKSYTATVQANGGWTVNVPAADLTGLPDGTANVQASVSNINGNTAQAERVYSVDATAPDLTINTVAGDDIINAIEHGQALVITGTSTGAEPGDVVTVTLNGKNYTTTLDASGNWSVGIPAADVTALATGSQTITASLSDRAGNSDSTTHDVTVDLSGPTLTINTVSGDDIINNAEKTQDLTISGGSSGLATGTTVTVMLNGLAYSATTDGSGNWSVTVPASAVGTLGEAVYSISASATDSAGNSGSTTHTVNVESLLPGVIINTVAGDDIINAAEIAVNQTISGQVTGTAEAGNTVTVTLGGNQYTATVQPDLSWSVSVPAADLQALGNGELTISASVTNSANNTGTTTHAIVIDANLPGLRVDTVAGDDVVNSIEHSQALVITGSSSGLTAGTPLTVVINNVTYGATVLADGTWSVGISAEDVSNWPAGTINIAVSGTNTAGTTTSISHPVTVDLAAVAITINTLSGDDVINAAEKGSDLQLSGTTSGVEAGQTITVIFGGKSYTTTVATGGRWGLTVPAADLATLPDGAANVQASVSNVAGNNAQATHAYSVDASAPTITINTIASDDILNAAEAGSALTISGTSTAEAGQTVTVTLNGVSYSGNVQADGSWSVSVPTGDLANLTASSYTVNAAVSDKAGNPASATHNLTVDLAAPVVTINTVAGDDIINATEHGQAQIISGSATGATTGNTVSVTIGTSTYTTMLDANGNWSIGVPASVISALAQGNVTITATVSDSAGNSGTASHMVTVALGAPILGINTIAVDDIINATEKGADLAISGSSNQPAGTLVTVTLNGQNYTTTADVSGNWSVTVPASAVSALGEATYTVTASATDVDGNSGSASHNVQVNTALPGITINVVASDDIINAAEAGATQTISGQVTRAAAGDTVTVTLGGATYTATVQADLSWSVDVPAPALQALGNGELTISASVTNSVGNTGNGTREITIDANLPGLRIDTVAGDDVVNIIEHGQALVITGSSADLAVGSDVTLTINGQTYVAAVLADGTWSIGVPAADVSAWPAGTVTITASGTSNAGNPVSVTHPVTVDLTAVAVSINAITADDVINAAEHAQAQIISGSATGAETGSTVTVTIGTNTFTTVLDASGNWSVGVPASVISALANGTVTINASVTDAGGNSGSATHQVTVNTGLPTITFNAISGGSTGLATGAQVTVTLNGHNYSTTTDTAGNWTLTVPVSDLAALGQANYTVSANATSAVGNTASSQANLLVDSGLPGVTINIVAGDDIINAAEAGTAQTISGVVTRAAAGDTVTVTLGGKTYTTTVQDNLSWSVSVPAADL